MKNKESSLAFIFNAINRLNYMHNKFINENNLERQWLDFMIKEIKEENKKRRR